MRYADERVMTQLLGRWTIGSGIVVGFLAVGVVAGVLFATSETGFRTLAAEQAAAESEASRQQTQGASRWRRRCRRWRR